ncbi:MAG: hypothetical protein KDE27_02940 [Planctomycetes bacterium]|nr:hypothetical protein [Planctomycetota bacterium]
MQLESMGAVLRPCPGHLLDAWIDYLEKKGVIVRNDQSYELAGQPDALGAYPDDARTSLHEAVIDHLQTADCPNLLRYAIPAIRSNGDSTTRKSVGRPSEVQSAFPLPATSNDLKRMRWERQRHLRELADFVPHAEIVFDWILATVQQRILSTASPPKKRQMSNEDRARLIQEHQAAHRQQIEDAMACADVPRLAELWHIAAENLAAPTGNPMENDLRLFWGTSLRLATAAEALGRPRNALLALRGAMIGLPGDVDQARARFARDSKLVGLRADAAAEIAAVLIAWKPDLETKSPHKHPEEPNHKLPSSSESAALPHEVPRQDETSSADRVPAAPADTVHERLGAPLHRPRPTDVGSKPRDPERAEPGRGAPSPQPQSPEAANDLVSIQGLADETGIPYSTLASRRLRKARTDQPKPIAKNEERRDLYRRADWEPLIAAIRQGAPRDA